MSIFNMNIRYLILIVFLFLSAWILPNGITHQLFLRPNLRCMDAVYHNRNHSLRDNLPSKCNYSHHVSWIFILNIIWIIYFDRIQFLFLLRCIYVFLTSMVYLTRLIDKLFLYDTEFGNQRKRKNNWKRIKQNLTKTASVSLIWHLPYCGW
jgi:hypothetical protein